MPSLDMARTRHELARGVMGQSFVDGCVQFKLKYVGGGKVTSVIVTTATDITMISVKDGVTYTDAFRWVGAAPNYITVGAIVEAISATGRWQARTMDALTTTTLGAASTVDGTITVDAKGEYNILSDTSTAGQRYLAYRLTYDRTFGTSDSFRDSHRVSLKEIVTSFTLGATDANGLKIYECTPPGNAVPYSLAEVLVYQVTPTSGAPATISWASGKGSITAKEGNDLLVIVTDATSFDAAAVLTINGELE